MRYSRLGFVMVLCVLGLVPRLLFLSGWSTNFDGDEGLQGVAAWDVLRGNLPLFLPGQCYMGTGPAMLAAPLVALFGSNAAAVRMIPLLFVPLGLLALLALERRENGPLSAGAGRVVLSLLWVVPPAALFLASVKARGGNLEALVLGLWSLVLLWPLSALRKAGAYRHTVHGAGAGALFGLALWTHDQSLLFLPALVALLAMRPRRVRLPVALAAVVGLVIGYAPFWLPRWMPIAVGPPSLEGAGYHADLSFLFTWAGVGRALSIIPAALTTHSDISALRLRSLLPLLTMLLVAFALIGPKRLAGTTRWSEIQKRLRCSPALTCSSYLALATVTALLASPDSWEDPQWFRYTLGITPFFVVATATGLTKLSPRPRAIGVIVLLVLNAWASAAAIPAWRYPLRAGIADLLRDLDRQGLVRVETDWELAYTLRYFSRDRILASCGTPVRFPWVNATVALADRSARVRPGPSSSPDSEMHGSTRHSFLIQPIDSVSPEAVRSAFARLDPRRTLFARSEPWPLLLPGEFPTDWRGWPYRRPMSAFNAIVIDSSTELPIGVDKGEWRRALKRLEASGRFQTTSDRDRWRFLERL